jgi:hypothetical protein
MRREAERTAIMPSVAKPKRHPAELTPIELERIVSLEEAARLGGVSTDTLRRNYPEKILQLSPKRRGMRLRDALRLPA